jgi:dGTPase
MLDRTHLEEALSARLAPYAARAAASSGRLHPEDEPPYRSLYQRDRDRIVHSWAFRRLQYKTQVFVSVLEGDYYRTRLTHTLEVTQLARTVARALALNEDLAEALALGHDLGHGPFGHSGESALDELMRDHGGFNHNLQGLRVVDLLERRYARFPGLNLTYETREGFAKNLGADRTAAGFRAESPTLEAQLVGHADEIAYDTHDLEDGLVSNVLLEDDLETVELWRLTAKEVLLENPGLRQEQRLRWRTIVRRLIGKLVLSLLQGTESRLTAEKIKTLADVRQCASPLAEFTPEIERSKNALETFLHENFYDHPRVKSKTSLWRRRLKALFNAYRAKPSLLPPDQLRRVEMEGEKLERVICDYVAGMTDRFATRQWEINAECRKQNAEKQKRK